MDGITVEINRHDVLDWLIVDDGLEVEVKELADRYAEKLAAGMQEILGVTVTVSMTDVFDCKIHCNYELLESARDAYEQVCDRLANDMSWAD